MQMFTRRTWIADMLVLAGLLLLAGALWLWFGLAALLGYVGAVCIVVGVVLASERRPV